MKRTKAPSKSKKQARGPASPKPAAKIPRWQRAPQELTELFAKLQDGLPPEAEKRKMFGYPCSFVNGQMFAGLHQTNMVLRLGEKERAEFLSIAGARVFEPLPGRVMKEYVVVPSALLADDRALFKWTLRAFTFARSLPPKVRKGS
jgi:TfoX/Sxy family transcriptional regulator of competence genes